MSDLIREFAKDADLDWHRHWNDETNTLENFANLIIEKCISIVDDAVTHRIPASEYTSIIREHFKG